MPPSVLTPDVLAVIDELYSTGTKQIRPLTRAVGQVFPQIKSRDPILRGLVMLGYRTSMSPIRHNSKTTLLPGAQSIRCPQCTKRWNSLDFESTQIGELYMRCGCGYTALLPSRRVST